MISGAIRTRNSNSSTLDANGNTDSTPSIVDPVVEISGCNHAAQCLGNTGAGSARCHRAFISTTSELIENGSFYGSSRQIFMTNNSFRMTGYGESVVALWGGRDFSMIGNDLANADENRDDGHGIGRFFVAQGHFGSMKNMYWGDNVIPSGSAP